MSNVNGIRVVQQEVVVAKQCDGCSRTEGDLDKVADTWAIITWWHTAWGNDSVDSHERVDVCSPPCYWRMISKALKQNEGRQGGTIESECPDLFARTLYGERQATRA